MSKKQWKERRWSVACARRGNRNRFVKKIHMNAAGELVYHIAYDIKRVSA